MTSQKKMDRVLNKIKYLAVCQTLDKSVALEIAKSLVSREIYAMEIAYRDKDNFDTVDECISYVRTHETGIMLGAATVTNVDIACRALVAGAQFCLSPGSDKKTIKFCQKNDLPIYPGVMTPSEIQAASNMGLTLLKFFPAVASGGVAMLKAFASPFPDIKFLVSGGVNKDNAQKFLALPNVALVSGTYLCKE